ncbi:MAG: hypothetical protein V4662_13640 [Verrucomicrobiota bacterium]
MTTAEAMQKIIGRALTGFATLSADHKAELLDAVSTAYTAVAATQSGGEEAGSSAAAALASSAQAAITQEAADLATLTGNFPSWP